MANINGTEVPWIDDIITDEDLAAESLGREHEAADRENEYQDWLSEREREFDDAYDAHELGN